MSVSKYSSLYYVWRAITLSKDIWKILKFDFSIVAWFGWMKSNKMSLFRKQNDQIILSFAKRNSTKPGLCDDFSSKFYIIFTHGLFGKLWNLQWLLKSLISHEK